MESAVLVDIAKVVQFPKGVEFVALPAVIRLQPLNDGLRSWVDCPYLPETAPSYRATSFITPRVKGLGFKNGELGIAQNSRVGGLGSRELIGQVVEGGPQVVQDVSENQAELRWWFSVYPENGGDDDITATLSLNLTVKSVRASVNVRGNFVFENLQVLLSPVKFERNVIEGLHAAQSHYVQIAAAPQTEDPEGPRDSRAKPPRVHGQPREGTQA